MEKKMFAKTRPQNIKNWLIFEIMIQFFADNPKINLFPKSL